MKYLTRICIVLSLIILPGCGEEAIDIAPQWEGSGSPSTGTSTDSGMTNPETPPSTPSTGGTSENPDEGGTSENPDEGGTAPTPKACSPECLEEEQCIEGVCLPICTDGLSYCSGDCLDLTALHLSSCTACDPDYCDSNGNLADGCDIYIKGNDSANCGACGQTCPNGQSCSEGTCQNICTGGTSFCSGQCLDLNSLHLKSCSTCADGFCDADGNLANGCEISTASDQKNCGTCGNVCGSDTVCQNGTCTPLPGTRMFVTVNDLNVRTGPAVSNTSIGALSAYTYITVYEEKNGWYRHKYNGQDGWSSGSYLLDACDECLGRKAIDYAEKFLYNSSTKLCTWDHLTHAPIIQNFTDLWAAYGTYNHGYNNNCANFVTACLKSVGLISKNHINITQISNHCDNGTDGYRKISMSQAKAGDIWVNKEKGHTELIIGYKDGTLFLIGSNNFSSGLSNVCQKDTGAKSDSYQRVSYAQTATAGFVCSRQ